jgi:starvation-inducible outer membrane lipoprotein
MIRHTTLALLACAALAACAARPDAIAPASMAGAYDGTTCSNARALLATEQARLDALSEQQEQAANGDALGVLLLGIPVSSATGGDKAGEIAASKGKINALQARLASCG